MFRIRKVPTGSGSTAVQVVQSGGHEIKVVKHLGSANSQQVVGELTSAARLWIETHSPQLPLFPKTDGKNETTLSSEHLELLATRPVLIHHLFLATTRLFGFNQLVDKIIIDLVFMRLVEPASKAASIHILSSEYGIVHSLRSLQRKLKTVTKNKTAIEGKAANYARDHLGFDYTIVFYDVTTLYFESFKTDEVGEGVKRPGFSKDNKHQQPQIVLGLVVTRDGFPVEFKTFAGNKFEGHTLIPSLKQFKRRHQTDSLTVVADAAMISQKNILSLKEEGVHYIVGARLANLSQDITDQIDTTLPRTDQANIRLQVEGKGILICQYSRKRAAKDKHETKKQVNKAKQTLKTPSKATKRLKFIRQTKSEKLSFNKDLFEKTKKLWGIKGYYTDQGQLTNQEIIDHYHNLWQVEKAFRMSKSDLQVRPMYHYKTEHIIAHLLICFMALCIAKHWERKTNLSIKKVIKLLKNIQDASIEDTLTQRTLTLRKRLTLDEKLIVEKLT